MNTNNEIAELEMFLRDFMIAIENELAGPNGESIMAGIHIFLVLLAVLAVLAVAVVVINLVCRWRIFTKAGEKGWKALIPFYSDYINYKIAWDGRIYLALLVGTIASSVLGALFGLINAGLGMVVSVIISTVVAGAKAVASMILQFKFARAFGKNDYFAVGLYFLNNIFKTLTALATKYWN